MTPKKQKGIGSYHKSSNKNSYQELLTNGWDTKIKDLKGKAVNDWYSWQKNRIRS